MLLHMVETLVKFATVFTHEGSGYTESSVFCTKQCLMYVNSS